MYCAHCDAITGSPDMAGDQPLILASASPRRATLLSQLGVRFETDSADIDETPHSGEKPDDYVQRMADSKSAAVAARYNLDDYWILAADTTVVIEGDVLGKPMDRFDGLATLARLSGREHTVMTAISLRGGDGCHSRLVETQVQFIQLDRQVCEAYLATDEPWDKAGAYGIQGLGGAFVSGIQGSYSNVVGLPLAETWQLLAAHGIHTALEFSGE